MKLQLELTDDEWTLLRYLVELAASPYAAEPYKDIYEADGYDEEANYHAAMKTLAGKIRTA